MCSHFLNKHAVALVLGAVLIPCAWAAEQSEHGASEAGGHEHTESSEAASAAAGAEYAGDPEHIAAGERLYGEYNCVGCHFRGGGGIGPAFLDSEWHHGGTIEDIHASIHHGLPDGMPAWGGRLDDEQIWQLAAFVKSFESDAARPQEPQPPVERSADALDAQPDSSRRAER